MRIPYLPLILVLLAVFSCTHRQEVRSYDGSIVNECLSDISTEIIAIPLETKIECKIENIKQIQGDGVNLFILNDKNEICHFNYSGNFLNKISLKNDSSIRSYTVNKDEEQIIVLDSLQQLHCYSYHGNKLDQVDISNSPLWRTLYKIVYHEQSFWMIAENLTADNHFEKWIYKLDKQFNYQAGVKLCNADLGRFYLEGYFSPELSITDGQIYVYSPLPNKETILQDTLYLALNNPLKNDQISQLQQSIYTVPVRMNKRFMIASYQTNCYEKENYLLCYDQKMNKAYPLHGFKDNFYQTGLVNDLQALDIFNNQFYFYKSGEEILESFPERNESDNPVLFFVTLKS